MGTRERLKEAGYTAAEIPQLFFLFDTDRDGQLSVHEFKLMMTEMKVGLGEERLVKLFHTFDEDGSGGIDDQEFVKTLFPQDYWRIYDVDSEASSEVEQFFNGIPDGSIQEETCDSEQLGADTYDSAQTAPISRVHREEARPIAGDQRVSDSTSSLKTGDPFHI